MESAVYSHETWVHDIYSREMESIANTHERWSPKHLFNERRSQQYLPMRGGVHISTSVMESTACTQDRRSPTHIHMRDRIVAVVLFVLVRGEAGTDTGG